jgi:hypothetical protein
MPSTRSVCGRDMILFILVFTVFLIHAETQERVMKLNCNKVTGAVLSWTSLTPTMAADQLLEPLPPSYPSQGSKIYLLITGAWRSGPQLESLQL